MDLAAVEETVSSRRAEESRTRFPVRSLRYRHVPFSTMQG